MSVVICDPARLLYAVVGPLGALSWLVYAIIPLTGLALMSAYFNWPALTGHIDRILFTLSFLQSLVISMLTANLLGKSAQAFAMARFGIAPNQFGIKLVFGVLPRFFIPLTPIRSLGFADQRYCYAAPLLTRLLMFAAGIVAWTLLRKSGSGAADVAIALAITGLASFLFTANPAWRADGYRWLSARLAMPKLREDSYSYLGFVLRRKPAPAALTPRKKRLLFNYALISIAYTAFLVGTVVTAIAIGLETRFQGVGVVIFGVIIGMVVLYFASLSSRKRARAARKAPPRAKNVTSAYKAEVSCYKTSQEVSEHPQSLQKSYTMSSAKGTKPQTPTTKMDFDLEAILPVRAPITQDDTLVDLDQLLEAAFAQDADPPASKPQLPAKRAETAVVAPTAREKRASDQLDTVLGVGQAKPKKTPFWRKLLIWVILVGGLTYAGLQPYPFSVGGVFIVQSVERSQVRARTSGEITSLLVGEGDWVEQGQVLAELSDWDAKRDIAIREAELARLQATLASLIAGPKPEEVTLTQQFVAAADANMEAARQQFERQEQLLQSGTVAQKALDDARTSLTVAQAEKDRAEAALALLISSALESDIAGARASIMRAEQELAFSQLQLEHTKIRAVVDGQIVTNLNTMALGAFLNEGDHFADIADDLTVMVEIEVPETQIDGVKTGAPAVLKPWSAPDKDLVGTVKRIAPAAEERDFGQVMRVLVEVPNPDGTLASNMTGFGKITVDERPAWQVFTRVFVRFFEVEIWSWVP
jgi:multidrug resistance efflux pump